MGVRQWFTHVLWSTFPIVFFMHYFGFISPLEFMVARIIVELIVKSVWPPPNQRKRHQTSPAVLQVGAGVCAVEAAMGSSDAAATAESAARRESRG